MEPPDLRQKLITWLVGVFLVAYLILIVPLHPPPVATQLAPASRVKVRRTAGGGLVPTVLFVISTTSVHTSRVTSIRNTWMQNVLADPSLDIIFVGDPGQDVFPELVHSVCPVGYYEDTCKRADMFTYAYEFLQRPQGAAIDWVYFADDDIYIFPHNLQRMILSMGHPATVNTTQMWAALGAPALCAYGDKCSGMCGGPGYFTNRHTISRIVEGMDKSKYSNLREEAAVFDQQCGRPGDIAITQVIKQHRKIPLVQYPETGCYNLQSPNGDTGLLASIQSKDPRPWLYHYPSRGRMEYIHQEGIQSGADPPLVAATTESVPRPYRSIDVQSN